MGERLSANTKNTTEARFDNKDITGTALAGDKFALDVNLGNASDISVDVAGDQISSFSNGNKNVTTGATIVNVSGTNLTNRGFVSIQPIDGDIYVGDASVTTSNGVLVKQNDIAKFKVSADSVDIYAIATSTIDCRIFEAVTA